MSKDAEIQFLSKELGNMKGINDNLLHELDDMKLEVVLARKQKDQMKELFREKVERADISPPALVVEPTHHPAEPLEAEHSNFFRKLYNAEMNHTQSLEVGDPTKFYSTISSNRIGEGGSVFMSPGPQQYPEDVFAAEEEGEDNIPEFSYKLTL